MLSKRMKEILIYSALILYSLSLPFIEYHYFELNRGFSGIFLIVAASLLGIKTGIVVAAYVIAVINALYYLTPIPINPEIMIREIIIYLVLTLVVGLVVEYYKITKNKLAESVTDLQNFKLALEDSRQQMLNIIDFLPDPTFVINSSGEVLIWNKAMEELTGIHAEKMVGKGNFEYSLALYGERKPSIIDLVIEQTADKELESQPHPVPRKGDTLYGDTIYYPGKEKACYLWAKASALYDSKDSLTGAIASLRDVTERKETEEKLKYLSFHDMLTGLYNRAFFEEELLRLNNPRQLPLSIIMGDVNELKLVNDTFGHQQGDKLLAAVARVIQSCCRREDIVCRWGGDEFAILLAKTDQQASLQICQRIKKACLTVENIPVSLSISIGTATKESPSQNLFETITTAEDMMYRNKILESKNSRGNVISSLQNLMKEKTEETVEHAARLNHYALQIGKAIGLPAEELHELSLLASLHDLGKVAIPDSIILKSDSLTEEEWEIMKQHSEIGYNMTRSVPELAHISIKILHHHEWWDGRGYPGGLAGEEIPPLSRIISIVDAYDVMTSGRSYKKSLSPQEALSELAKYSGSHFEPKLVEIFSEILRNSNKQVG